MQILETGSDIEANSAKVSERNVENYGDWYHVHSDGKVEDFIEGMLHYVEVW